jgi:hypothetical protein
LSGDRARTGDADAHCGRNGHPATWTTPARARRWGAWAVAVAVAIPTFYALTRWAWALGIPLGFSREALRAQEAESPGIWLAGAGLAHLRAMLHGQISLNWGTGPALLWPLWGPALGAATLAYHLRRRDACRHCNRS